MADKLFWLEPGGVLNLAGTSTGLWAIDGFVDDVWELEGITGLQMPPIRRKHQMVAGVNGTRLLSIAHDMRTFLVPLLVRPGGDLALKASLRAWRQRLNPLRGDGQLIVITEDGLTMSLACRCVAGFEGDEGPDIAGTDWQLYVLTFEADDPYFYDIDAQTDEWTIGGAAPTWFGSGNILPIQLGASSLSGLNTLDIGGEVETWPIWTVRGPGADIVVTNLTTQKSWGWGSTLIDSDVLVVDTRPGIKTVLLNGAPASDGLTAWQLWSLMVGANDVQVAIASASSSSSIAVTRHNARLGR